MMNGTGLHHEGTFHVEGRTPLYLRYPGLGRNGLETPHNIYNVGIPNSSVLWIYIHNLYVALKILECSFHARQPHSNTQLTLP